MPRNKGYRVDRLSRRRRTEAERWQAWVLYGLAGVVAFAAVMGAWYLGSRWLRQSEKPRQHGYLALVTLTAPSTTKPVAAALAIKSASGDQYSLYVIPRELLLDGPAGEYVFAGDAMESGALRQDLQRVIHAKIDVAYSIPVKALAQLAGGGDIQLTLARSVKLDVGGTDRTFAGKAVVSTGDLAALFAAGGPTGQDAASLQQALWSGALQAAALQSAGARAKLAQSAAGGSPVPTANRDLSDLLTGLSAGSSSVAIVPSAARVAEGQFAFVPDPEGIMAQITRKSAAYHSRYTILVRNGTGKVGIGQAVAQRLATLDVNLPAVGNAASFGYRRTQIIAGRNALQVAQDIHAILGAGVVLDGGTDVASTTVVVIVGSDLNIKNLEAKD
jgi:hypothetical protein